MGRVPNKQKHHFIWHNYFLCTMATVPPELVAKIEAGFRKLQAYGVLNITKELVDSCKHKRTKFGATLIEAFDNEGGANAPDAESYTVFKPFFDIVINDHHRDFDPQRKHPATDFGDGRTHLLTDLDPDRKFVMSTRIRCCRSIEGYPFNPCLTKEKYLEIEEKVKGVFETLKNDPELAGTYYPLQGMTKEVENRLIADHVLFAKSEWLEKANACQHWPAGRGIYYNAKKTFLIWVNEEDHLRIISMESGGNVQSVFERLIKGVKAIEAKLPFSRDDRLGWLTFCPSNLGTTVRASVHIRLHQISGSRDFKQLCSRRSLDIRGLQGETDEAVGGDYDISNKRRLGLTEFEAVKLMHTEVQHLISLETQAQERN
ncbi:hypothetical protein GPALN_014613 [Globodera pallida]|nr:hypothetical protein GPALN_014613 [Globodera pallida]